MRLLVFAHRAEAGEFFRAYPDFNVSADRNVYQSKQRNATLLICGQGPEKAGGRLAALLADKIQYSEIINLGIAGSLTPDSTPGDVLFINQVRVSISPSLLTLSLPDPNVPVAECSSFDKPVTEINGIMDDIGGGKKQLVDMELFSLVSVARKYSIPVTAIKVVSDMVGAEEQFRDIRAKLPHYSRLLYQMYEQYFK
jgi:nucleoside phosphorylase